MLFDDWGDFSYEDVDYEEIGGALDKSMWELAEASVRDDYSKNGNEYQEFIWTTKEGKDVRLRDMSDRHLLNVHRYLMKRLLEHYDYMSSLNIVQFMQTIIIFEKEVDRRGLKVLVGRNGKPVRDVGGNGTVGNVSATFLGKKFDPPIKKMTPWG